MKISLSISVILFILFCNLFSQTQKIDTSFTVFSAYQKAVKDFPFIKIVKPILPENVNAIRNLSYVKYGERELKLDIFYHANNKNYKPAVILIHGGGWHSGNKSHQVPLAMELAKNGFVSATIEYRFSQEAIFPAAIIDVKNSIKWLKKNSEKFKIDTNKIAVLGFSAGGQIASLVGFTPDYNEFEDENFSKISSKVHAIINVDGLLDFLHSESKEFDEVPNMEKPRSAHLWFGVSQIENPEIWKKGSPINYITEKSCPILFINSSIPFYHAGRDDAIFMLKSYKIYFEQHTIENTPHPFWLFHPWFDETKEIIINFLNKLFVNKNE
ncbi:MAG: alpha/beta hydrolase [Ignavibacteriae bacterium]|nr:alpha/beta hydrolase [Ignavibacteriota bacterium]